MHSVVALAAALLLLPLVACTPASERAEEARREIEEALAQGDRSRALRAVATLRESLPETPEALREVAEQLVRAGGAPDAGWLLEDAVRRHPERDDLRLALARVALLLGNPTLARQTLAPVEEESADHAAALVLRAQAELHLGEFERALATLAEAERLHPERDEARLVRIATLLAEDRHEEARAAIEQARGARSGDDEETRELRRRLDLTLAQLRARQGEAAEAVADLERRLAEDPGDLLAWRTLVAVLVGEDRAEEALARLETTLASSDAAPADLHALAASLHAALGRDAEAERALRIFVARSDAAAAVMPLLDFLWARSRVEDASAVLDASLARFPDEPMLRLLRVEALLAQERVEDARAEAERFREATFPGDPQVEYLRARLELAQGDAAAAAERLRRLAPQLDRAPTHYWLGRALEESGDIEGARRRYGLAQRHDPGWTAPAAARLALAQRRGDWATAAAEARTLVGRAPYRLEGWVAWVEALERLGQGAAAEEAARHGLERFPERPEPHVLLARALRAQGRTDEALAALDAASALEPSALVASERILTLGMGGRVEEGLAVARAALGATPEAPELHAASAALLFAANAADEGARATDRALALAPDAPRPLRVRCEFRAATGRFAEAAADCARYLAARPDDAGAHFMHGLALAGTGDAEGAIAAYRRAAALDPNDVRPRNNVAELLAARGDLDGALAAAQEAYRLAEDDPYVMDTLGSLYARKGLLERAVSLLEEAHGALPDLPEVSLHLALAYRDAGRPEEARTLLAGLERESAGDPRFRARVEEALRTLP